MFLSSGVETFLRAIDTWGRAEGETRYPPDIKNLQNTKFKNSDNSTRDWFVRVVDQELSGHPERCAIEENIAIFATLKWEEGRKLKYANLQCLIALKGSLEDAYLDETIECEYLRLDFDSAQPGSLFTHPIPHVHIKGSRGPRFGLRQGESGHVVFDFLDFIYRNYMPEKWENWLSSIWDELGAPQASLLDDGFQNVSDALHGKAPSDILFLADYQDTIKKISECIQTKRESSFAPSIPEKWIQLANSICSR